MTSMFQVSETGDTFVIKIDVAWWVCSLIFVMVVCSGGPLLDGRQHEAIVLKPLALARHRDSSLELCPLGAPIWCAQTLPHEPTQQGKPQARAAPRCCVCSSLIVLLAVHWLHCRMKR